jgi:Glycosyl transferase family 2
MDQPSATTSDQADRERRPRGLRRLAGAVRRRAWAVALRLRASLRARAARLVVSLNTRHLSGPRRVRYGTEELLVICLVRNGALYVDGYIRHYTRLGVKHVVLLDNGSTDDTVARASAYGNVTVLACDLPYATYENPMKDYLARRFSAGRWNLCADIDELFDYPYSESCGLRPLLRRMNERGDTAVVAQLLDLFSDGPMADHQDRPGDDLAATYRYYDLASIETSPYRWSVLTNPEVRMHHGGIRAAVFGTKNGLTKAPLVFVGRGIRLFVDWHHVEGARVADFTCVLRHYPFTSGFYDKVRDAAETSRYGLVTTDEYLKYWRRLEHEPGLNFRRQTSRAYAGIGPLFDAGFLVASADFLAWAHAQAASS